MSKLKASILKSSSVLKRFGLKLALILVAIFSLLGSQTPKKSAVHKENTAQTYSPPKIDNQLATLSEGNWKLGESKNFQGILPHSQNTETSNSEIDGDDLANPETLLGFRLYFTLISFSPIDQISDALMYPWGILVPPPNF